MVESVDPFEGRECEFVREVARELPLQTICLLLGVPQEDRSQLCDWVDLGLEYADLKQKTRTLNKIR